mmetsp:Transcript_1848/g.4726  ORF Transcript_1848/g.4726 Transcript_1848/m.4726 type:complete len:103 (-) Transcript_1848:1792-2100(-)
MFLAAQPRSSTLKSIKNPGLRCSKKGHQSIPIQGFCSWSSTNSHWQSKKASRNSSSPHLTSHSSEDLQQANMYKIAAAFALPVLLSSFKKTCLSASACEGML